MGVGLARSKKSARLMAAVAVISFVVGELAMNALISLIQNGSVPALLPDSQGAGSLIGGVALLILGLLFAILLGGLLIFRLFQGDVH